MKFRQNSWRIKLGIIVGIIFFLLGIVQWVGNWNLPGYSAYLNILIGLLWIGVIWYQNKTGYFQVTENEIIQYGIFKTKKVNLTDLKQITYQAGDYTFKDSENEIRIVKEMIDKKDLPKFERILEKLNYSHAQ